MCPRYPRNGQPFLGGLLNQPPVSSILALKQGSRERGKGGREGEREGERGGERGKGRREGGKKRGREEEREEREGGREGEDGWKRKEE